MEILKTSERVKVENYPYGFILKTDVFFSLEYKKGKGFRKVFQSVNPKTGLLNKPKKSTYSPIKILARNEGKIFCKSFDFYGNEGKDSAFKFLYEHFDKFKAEEIKGIAVAALSYLKADMIAKVQYCNSKPEELMPLYDKAVKTLVKIAKTGENLFNEVVIDWKAVEATEEKGYNPFKIKTVSMGV